MITIISIILSIIVIILIAYNFWVKQVTYLITYAIDVEGKRQVDSCEYTISARHGIAPMIKIVDQHLVEMM